MDYIPNIFVGSSTEGKIIADIVIDKLKGFADCTIWTEAFEMGKSNFDNLTGQIGFYDYAILIATGDDVIKSRKKQQKTGRDNVLFEFGLFTGGLGYSRTFYILEENTKIPSDLLGVTLPLISTSNDTLLNETLEICVSKIKNHVTNKENTFDLGFLPSTALAYGYFSNFLSRAIENLLVDKSTEREFSVSKNSNFKIQNLKFTVLIPNDLSDDMFSKVKVKRLDNNWKKLNITSEGVRDYDFTVNISKATSGELHLIDIPLTLNALNKSIEFYSKKQHIGKSVKERILEEREIRNFKRTLEYLINSNSITKGIVEVEIVDI